MSLPVAHLRAHIGGDERGSDRFDVVVDGEPIAELHPTSVSYEMDWSKGMPQVVVRFFGGVGDLETRPARSRPRAA